MQPIEFVEPLTVHELAPTCGPYLGGTQLQLTAGPLKAASNAYACRIGALTIPATVIDWNKLTCITPPLLVPDEVGLYRLEITNNMQDYSDGGRFFQYDALLVETIIPSAGPLAGGTKASITIHGACQMNLVCLFGSAAPTRATWESAHIVVCNSPRTSLLRGGHVPLRLGADGVILSTVLPFNYLPRAEVLHAAPSTVSAHGGTRCTAL